MGTYRFILAIAVALSHMGVTFMGGHNPGVVAVISFFLISGFVMTGLVRSYYSEYRKVPMFYLDRLARIFPQYLLFMVLAAAGYFFLGFSSPYLSEVSLAAAVANMVVVPLDFFMYSTAIAGCMFIPQAWSLGLELTFYLLFPLVLIGGRRNLWFVLSLLVWLVASFGVINTDAWGYRLLPGTLFIFLLGSYIYDFRQPSIRHPAVMIFVLMMVCAAVLYESGKIDLPYSFEVLLGLFVGVPALFFLARCKRKGWDDWLGNLSYGIFLCHFLVIWMFDLLGVAQSASSIALMMAASVTLAYFGYVFVELPALIWRHGLRRSSGQNEG
ncbi:MAG TPA: acyltransferase [Gallionella sp.]|nr:acyltransferase [Gallionella sp.]